MPRVSAAIARFGLERGASASCCVGCVSRCPRGRCLFPSASRSHLERFPRRGCFDRHARPVVASDTQSSLHIGSWLQTSGRVCVCGCNCIVRLVASPSPRMGHTRALPRHGHYHPSVVYVKPSCISPNRGAPIRSLEPRCTLVQHCPHGRHIATDYVRVPICSWYHTASLAPGALFCSGICESRPYSGPLRIDHAQLGSPVLPASQGRSVRSRCVL